MASKCRVSNSVLLARIDERTENIQEDVQELKEAQQRANGAIQLHNSRLIHLEVQDKKNIHFENNCSNKFLKTIFGFFLKI